MASTQDHKKSGGAKATIDHQIIREWVESRGGKPATVKGTERGGKDADEHVGILRIDFPGYSGEDKLQEISWDAFFEKFDEAGLAMLFQEETAGGDVSRFSKFVKREHVDDRRTEIVEASADDEGEQEPAEAKGSSKKSASGASSKSSSSGAGSSKEHARGR